MVFTYMDSIRFDLHNIMMAVDIIQFIYVYIYNAAHVQ